MNGINKYRVKQAFATYVEAYNANDEKVKLKIDHTYRVADLCERIAKEEGLNDTDVRIAWLCGMLHDVGRFEQLRRYNTFNDAESVDHAALGAQILFDDGKLADYMEETDEEFRAFIRRVISCHSMYRVPEDYTEREKCFADILRDADKIDILKVNVEVPLEEIYNVTTQDLRNAEVTKEVMESFLEQHATLRALKKTSVDHVVGHISLVYELVYPCSLRIVLEQGYLDKLMHFQSNNPVTLEQFKILRDMMRKYVDSQLSK